MATFDAEVFARTLLSEAQWIIDGAAGEASVADRYQLDQVRSEVRELTRYVEATVAALGVERDPKRAKFLRDEFMVLLPARSASIRASAMVAAVPSLSIQSLGLSLEFASRCATIVSRSFITGSGL